MAYAEPVRSRDNVVKFSGDGAQPFTLAKPTIPSSGFGTAPMAPLAPSAFNTNSTVPAFGAGVGAAGGASFGGIKPTISSYATGGAGGFGTNFGAGSSGFGAGATGFGGGAYGNANTAVMGDPNGITNLMNGLL